MFAKKRREKSEEADKKLTGMKDACTNISPSSRLCPREVRNFPPPPSSPSMFLVVDRQILRSSFSPFYLSSTCFREKEAEENARFKVTI